MFDLNTQMQMSAKAALQKQLQERRAAQRLSQVEIVSDAILAHMAAGKTAKEAVDLVMGAGKYDEISAARLSGPSGAGKWWEKAKAAR